MGRKHVLVPSETALRDLVRTPTRIEGDGKERLRRVIIRGDNAVDISDADWNELERIITQFDINRALGNATLPRDAVQPRLGRLARKASAFLQELRDLSSQATSLNPEAIQIESAIQNALKDRWHYELAPRGKTGHYEWDLNDIVELIEQFVASTASSDIKIDHASPKDFGFRRLCREARSWWENATGLPASARKDDDKRRGGHSPFVEFFDELLKAIPSDTRPPVQSRSALAKAISDAWRDE